MNPFSLGLLSFTSSFNFSCSSSKSTKFLGASTCSFDNPDTARDFDADTARFALEDVGDGPRELVSTRWCGERCEIDKDPVRVDKSERADRRRVDFDVEPSG